MHIFYTILNRAFYPLEGPEKHKLISVAINLLIKHNLSNSPAILLHLIRKPKILPCPFVSLDLMTVWQAEGEFNN